MCEQNFTALIYEKAKKENNRYICIGIHSNCSPASAKVIFVYMFLMISRTVSFVTKKLGNPNKSNTFHNYLLAPVISQLRTVQTQRIVISFSPSLIRIKVVICHTSFYRCLPLFLTASFSSTLYKRVIRCIFFRHISMNKYIQHIVTVFQDVVCISSNDHTGLFLSQI